MAGLKFKAMSSKVNENLLIKKFQKRGFKNLVKILSLAKAKSIVETQHVASLQGNETIVAFDTIVVCENKIISKPRNRKDALRKLLFLSGKEHKVYTGIAIVKLRRDIPRYVSTPIIKTDCEVTKVYMKTISKQEALSYINTGEPLGKAGAYGIQGKGKKFVKKISGDYLNVVGLPLRKFLAILKKIH